MGPTNLPLTGTSFHGRATRLAEVTAALANAPVVTLVGPGGVGKTRLALEVARARQASFPAGVWLVDLGPVGRRRGVAGGRTARRPPGCCCCSTTANASSTPSRAWSRLAGACPLLRVLCTSREPLGLAAEVVVPVDPLDEGAAVALFLDRARAVDPGFAASADEVDRLPSVCARLDNLPLAIELAAPWVRLASVAELPRLVGRYELTPSTRRDLPARQRTMRATALWSHDLLDATQQVLLRRLAIFPDTFDLAAVAAVVAGPPLDAGTVEEPLAQLVERSMVKVHRTGEERGTGCSRRSVTSPPSGYPPSKERHCDVDTSPIAWRRRSASTPNAGGPDPTGRCRRCWRTVRASGPHSRGPWTTTHPARCDWRPHWSPTG